MWITFYKLVSRYKSKTLFHEANISGTTQPTSKEDTSTITSKCSLLKENAELLFNQITNQKSCYWC